MWCMDSRFCKTRRSLVELLKLLLGGEQQKQQPSWRVLSCVIFMFILEMCNHIYTSCTKLYDVCMMPQYNSAENVYLVNLHISKMYWEVWIILQSLLQTRWCPILLSSGLVANQSRRSQTIILPGCLWLFDPTCFYLLLSKIQCYEEVLSKMLISNALATSHGINVWKSAVDIYPHKTKFLKSIQIILSIYKKFLTR